VRQGESTSEGKWIGNPVGGVKAPEPIILPNPSKRFIRTESRLVELAAGHPMEPWLLFMAKLSQAQHAAATSLAPSVPADDRMVDQAVAARMPPFAADGHRRDPAWREGLAILLDNFDSETLPPEAKAIIADLRGREANALEALANNFLQGSLSSAEGGATLFVTAALQVYVTRLAAQPMPLLWFDTRFGCHHRLGQCAGNPLFILLALLDGVESRADHLHHVRRSRQAVSANN
jgi:FdhE protein